MSYGIHHLCDICNDFVLCFKCYRSRNEIHPDHTFSETHADQEYVSNEVSLVSSTASSSSILDFGDVDYRNVEIIEGGGAGSSSEDGTDFNPKQKGVLKRSW